MATLLALSLTVIPLLLAPKASGYLTRHKPAGYVDNHLHGFRLHTNKVRASKCLPKLRFTLAADELPAEGTLHRRNIRTTWKRYHFRATHRSSQCAPVIPWPWSALAQCESGGNWAYNGSSGFDGGLQFLPSTWNMAKVLVAGASQYAYAWQAPAVVQVRVAQAWLARTSWAQWPACSAALGLR